MKPATIITTVALLCATPAQAACNPYVGCLPGMTPMTPMSPMGPQRVPQVIVPSPGPRGLEPGVEYQIDKYGQAWGPGAGAVGPTKPASPSGNSIMPDISLDCFMNGRCK